jgi:ABC-type polysaccharide/polyol phosphate transport system ATPase subunit
LSDIALRMEHVYKKFRRGEIYNSLRDFIPALTTGRLFRSPVPQAIGPREFWALQDLSFEVERGEAFGIIGPNGAGKSTALKILSRIIRPTSGRMVINGRLSALIEVTAGFHQDLTGRENIFLFGTIMGMTKHEIRSKLDQIIAFSGIEEFIDTPVKRYSTGMFARLGFSVAAHVDPEVLLVDEVLSVGDYRFQRQCLVRMKEIIRSGATVVFVSHDLKNVSEFCNRCLLLEKGRTVMTGPAHKVVSDYLQQPQSREAREEGLGPVVISKIVVRNEAGECARFQSGQNAWIDVELRARASCVKVTVGVWITNERNEILFETTMERLGYGNLSLEADDVFRCTFEISLNLTGGLYHLSALIYRHDTQTTYDEWMPAATIYVSSEEDVKGYVHCFPKVIDHRIIRVTPPNSLWAKEGAAV